MEPKVLQIEGTVAAKPFSWVLYSRLAGFCGQARKSIPYGGALPIMHSYRLIEHRLEAVVGDNPAVVCGHSQGGLLARLFASRHPNVQAVVVAAPNNGTDLCRLVPFGAFKDMIPDSLFLRRLAEEEDPERVTNVYVYGDRAITQSPYLPGARNILFASQANCRLLVGNLPSDVELRVGSYTHITIARTRRVGRIINEVRDSLATAPASVSPLRVSLSPA